jgi:hypothetical protein
MSRPKASIVESAFKSWVRLGDDDRSTFKQMCEFQIMIESMTSEEKQEYAIKQWVARLSEISTRPRKPRSVKPEAKKRGRKVLAPPEE